MLDALVILLNRIEAASIELRARLSSALTGRRSERVSLPDGVSVLLKLDRQNNLRVFLVERDLSVFPRLGFADSYFVHRFRGTRDWDEPVAAFRRGLPASLPPPFLWHGRSGRIVFNTDGELFSLALHHVEAIDAVVQASLRKP